MKKIIIEPKEFNTLKALIPFVDYKVSKGMVIIFITFSSVAKAIELYRDFPWIVAQIDEAVEEATSFTKA